LTKISLTEISKYNIEYQQGIFRSLTAKNKKRLWAAKLDILLTQTQMWSTKELTAITQLKTLVNKLDFGAILSKDENDNLNNWVKDAQRENGWSDEQLIYILSSLSVDAQSKDDIRQVLIKEYESTANSEGDSGGGKPKCTCRVSFSGCNILHDCVPDGCATTSGGCGALWLQDCTGTCYVSAS
jgi:hypothetical protein